MWLATELGKPPASLLPGKGSHCHFSLGCEELNRKPPFPILPWLFLLLLATSFWTHFPERTKPFFDFLFFLGNRKPRFLSDERSNTESKSSPKRLNGREHNFSLEEASSAHVFYQIALLAWLIDYSCASSRKSDCFS